jgi:nicotinate-nucleotide pyrophosphorylase (carboxylating)
MILGINRQDLLLHIRAWLAEDIGTGDITTSTTIPQTHTSLGIIHVKEEGILAGMPIAALVFEVVDPHLSFTPLIEDGQPIHKGDVLARIEGNTHSIVTGERLALNLLQRLSGVASKTRTFVDAVGDLPVRLVDTRKTTPGLRALEKYAVRVGGGANHRFGLYDAVMIKDNHIKGAGGITAAVARARQAIPHTMTIEVETESLAQVDEALAAGADIIMFDNMSLSLLREAVQKVHLAAPHVKTEASGGVRLETVRAIAETGVDVISVGSLTYSYQSLDISLDLGEKKG